MQKLAVDAKDAHRLIKQIQDAGLQCGKEVTEDKWSLLIQDEDLPRLQELLKDEMPCDDDEREIAGMDPVLAALVIREDTLTSYSPAVLNWVNKTLARAAKRAVRALKEKRAFRKEGA